MSFITISGAFELGCIFAILSLGLYIAFRVLDLPDLTVDGSFVTGIAISAVMTTNGHPLLGIVLGVIAGGMAGAVTGILHTKLHIHAILSGILTMTALYSINFFITGDRPSIFFYEDTTMFSFIEGNIMLGGADIGKGIILIIIVVLLVIAMNYFLRTQVGLSLRATGDNEAMVRSSSINTDAMKILGFVLCNALVSLSGAIYAQYNKTATLSVGTGMLVLGLASIIIGETIVGKKSIIRQLIAVVVGAIIYRFMLTFAFQLGLPANGLKLFSAIIVVIAISIPLIKPTITKVRKRHAESK